MRSGRGEETLLEKGFLSPPQTPPLSFPRLSTGGEATQREFVPAEVWLEKGSGRSEERFLQCEM